MDLDDIANDAANTTIEALRSDKQKPGRSGWGNFASTFAVFIGAALVAVLMMMFVFRSYQVDGPSMQPTLHHGDRLIIWKVPRTWARITQHDYIPNRGDIIVFSQNNLATSNGESKELIKRVIGLPGDRIVIENGAATIYNNEHPEGFQPDRTLPYGEGLSLAIDSEERIEEMVGANQVFVMGDNRDHSLDSRAFGPISADHIVGKLVLRVFPLGDAEKF